MKKILIVVDYQNDFVDGSLGCVQAEKIENNIVRKIEKCRNDGYDIGFTFDIHKTNYLKTQEGINLPVAHCIENTNGCDLYGKVRNCKQEKDLAFYKNTFGSKDLFEFFIKNEYDTIELCGVVTNICVITNALLAKTALPEAKIIVDKNCVASNDDNLNVECLDVMKSLQIQIIE